MGFVRNGCDVDGVIASLHGQALFAGLIACLPWLVNPFVKHRLLKDYLLPRKGDRTGTGKLMTVSAELDFKEDNRIFKVTLTESQYRDEQFDRILTDPQLKHENVLAQGCVRHEESYVKWWIR